MNPRESWPRQSKNVRAAMLPSSRLLQEEPPTSIEPIVPSAAPPTLPSILIDDVDVNDDDPPPYSAVVPPDHLGWTFDFSVIPYSACVTTSRGAEATPLSVFQTGPGDTGPGSNVEGPDGQHAAISMPLMPRRLFMFGSRRSLFPHGPLPFSDNISACKDGYGSRRKYGAILIGATMIIFLMALSLLVRFVMDKHLWRG